MNKKVIRYSIFFILILCFVGSGGYLLHYYMESRVTQDNIEELVKVKEDARENQKDVTKGYMKLAKENKDMVGWIKIAGTSIDYPVMQTPNEEEFYLHRNFKKDYDVNGLPFLNATSNVKEKKDNLVVYSHHMKSGLMFAKLLSYDSKEFYEKHKLIHFDTIEKEQKYEVVAAFYTRILKNKEQGFRFYDFLGKLGKKEFKEYVENIRKIACYDTGIQPKYGEQLLTLVTCSYQAEEGRFVVVARRK